MEEWITGCTAWRHSWKPEGVLFRTSQKRSRSTGAGILVTRASADGNGGNSGSLKGSCFSRSCIAAPAARPSGSSSVVCATPLRQLTSARHRSWRLERLTSHLAPFPARPLRLVAEFMARPEGVFFQDTVDADVSVLFDLWILTKRVTCDGHLVFTALR